MNSGSHQSRLRMEPLEDRTLMSTCQVTRFSDAGMGNGFRGDLRYCINKVNAEPGPDVIAFQVTGTINLTGVLPKLNSDIEIQGPGADLLTIRRDTGGSYRIFTVLAGVNVQMSGITIANGHPVASGFLEKDGWGGGMYNSGSLTLTGAAVVGNSASSNNFQRAGGIYNEGLLTVVSSLVAYNSVPDSAEPHTSSRGGGIFNKAGATLILSNSTISNNTAIAIGFNNNTEASGGGIENEGSAILHISNTTISANSAVKNGVPLSSGGIAGSQSTIKNTIVSGNAGGDCNCPMATNIIGGDAMLGSLADNGGPTLTMALLPGSPAIDAGDNADAPEWDQRGPGFPRIVYGTIDIGAFEVQASGAPSSSGHFAVLVSPISEALKGRETPTQGKALGNEAIIASALKGRNQDAVESDVTMAPLQGLVHRKTPTPRALPWADLFRPVGAEIDIEFRS